MSNSDLKKELEAISEESRPSVCGINTSVHSESEIDQSGNIEKDLDHSLEKPQVCSIDTKETNEPKPQVCGIDNDLKEKLEKLTEDLKPQVCGIDKNDKSPFANIKEETPEVCGINKEAKDPFANIHEAAPDVCSIDKSAKSPFANIKESAPSVCSIKHGPGNKPNVRQDHTELLDENIIDTYGFNVPATPEERAELLKGFAEQQKLDASEIEKVENELPEITVVKNGPYIVKGDVPIYDGAIKIDKSGQSIGWDDVRELKDKKVVVLCRCGRSKNMPFCDDTHEHIHFDGTCTAPNTPYDEAANIYKGCQDVYLMDEESLCAIVRFCDPDGSCWNLIKDEKTVDIAQQESFNCASGRLTLVKDGKKIEPKLDKEIEAIYDTERDVLGPLWVKGGIPVKTEKVEYECRNRQTLCRCGWSENKPFCDGMHLDGPKLNEEEIKENE